MSTSRKKSASAKTDKPLDLLAAVNGRPTGRVSFRVRRLEPHIALALAGFTAWAGIFLNPDGLELWAVAFYAAAIGGWARTFPAGHVGFMALRGALLLLGAFQIHMIAGLGGPAGVWMLWPLAIAGGYGLLLPLPWGGPLFVLAFAEFVLACLFATPPVAWREAFALGGGLWFAGVIAILLGRSLRAPDEKAQQGQVDARTQLYNEVGFFSNGGELYAECRRNKRPFTLVLLSGADLRDASELLGKKAANELLSQLVRALAAATPPGGLAARTDSVEFALALPGVSAERADVLIKQRLGDEPKVEITIEDNKAAVVLDTVIAEASANEHTLEELYDGLHLSLRKRIGAPVTVSSERSTLQGMLRRDPVVSQSMRPTLPMTFRA